MILYLFNRSYIFCPRVDKRIISFFFVGALVEKKIKNFLVTTILKETSSKIKYKLFPCNVLSQQGVTLSGTT